MDALQRALKDSLEEMRAQVAQAVAVTTFAAAQGVRARAPRDTGLLLSQITSSSRGLRGVVEMGVDAFYWPWVEYGTVKMAARPFVRPAAEAEFPNLERRLRDIGTRLERGFTLARAA
jgi:HK97 gp10 family phage protein